MGKGKTALMVTTVFCIIIIVIPCFSYSYNLTGFLHFNLNGEFDSPLIWKNVYKTSFFEGWGDIPETINVAVKPVSKYRFFTYGGRDIKVLLEMEKYDDSAKNLKLRIYINDQLLNKVNLGKSRKITFSIPAVRLIAGINYIKFKVLGKNPVFKRKKYNENIKKLFVLKNIKFLDFPVNTEKYIRLEEKDNRFYQPANTFFSIAVNPEKDAFVSYNFVFSGDSTVRNTLLIENGSPVSPNRILEKFSIKKGVTQKTIVLNSLRKNEISRLTFKFASEKRDNFLIWDQFEIKQKKSKKKIVLKKRTIPKRPHIIFVILDAARADLIGKKVLNSEITPNINRFNKSSTVFSNFYTSSPFTATSMATFFSGMFPEVHNLGKPPLLIPDSVKLLSDILRTKKYKTYLASGNPLILHSGFSERFDKAVSIRPEKINYGKFSDTSYNNSKKLLKFIEDIDFSSPVFLYIHLLPPHYPYVPPEKKFKNFSSEKSQELLGLSTGFNDFSEKFLESTYLKYLDNMSYSDFISGEIMDKLKKKGCYNNSLVIFASDHGEAFGEHGFIMHGYTNYVEMLKILFSAKFPGQKKMRIVDDFFSNVDFLPSILKWTGINDGRDFQGRDCLFEINGQKNSKDKFLYSKAITPFLNSSIFDSKWKYIFNSGREELYSQKKDPYERKNLIDKKPYISLYLKRILFGRVIENRIMKNLFNIKSKRGKIDEEFKEELKTLGYL